MIYEVRGQQVILDTDLAQIYGYSTKGFNRQIKNNIEKFDDDFMFQLSNEEAEILRCKNSTSSSRAASLQISLAKVEEKGSQFHYSIITYHKINKNNYLCLRN